MASSLSGWAGIWARNMSGEGAAGEAPSGILPCDSAKLPLRYRSTVLVTSWGDHALELYRPRPFGASLRAEREVIVQGDDGFRPVAIAAAPDGAVYFTDWVDKDYSVHGKGRIWRLATRPGVKAARTSPAVAHASLHRAGRGAARAPRGAYDQAYTVGRGH